MDAKHLHMEIVNRRDSNAEAYARCVAVLERFRALPGQENDPGEKEGYDLAKALGEAIKDMIRAHARDRYRLTDDGTDVAAVFFTVSLDHISAEQLGAAFYVTTRERYRG